MKILKLTLIFAALVGALVLLLNWGSIFSPSIESEEFPDVDALNLEERCNSIRTAWNDNGVWNQHLYDSQRAEIKQDSAMHLFSHASYNIVRTCIKESATNNVYNCYKSALHPDAYTHDKVIKNYRGIEHIKTQELNMTEDERIKEISAIHNLYKRIYDFSRNGKHPMVAHFNADENSWIPFNTLQSNILATARSYSNNPHYKHLKDIPGFDLALNQSNLTEITESYRNTFYSQLKNQIIEHFEQLKVNRETFDKYNEVYKRFTDESTTGAKDLAISVQKLKEKLERN